MVTALSQVNYLKLWENEFGINGAELTQRERVILSYLAKGYLNKQIALKASITEQTTKNHITNIFRKLGVSNRTEAVVKAISMKVVSIYPMDN